MEIKTESIAAEPATLHPNSGDRYAPVNMMLYRTSLALVHSLVNEGVFSADEYDRIRTILNKKYNFPSGSIFAESA